MKPKRLSLLVLALAAIALLAAFGCGEDNPTSNDDGGGGGATVSTDAAKNEALLTTFTGANSVTVAGTWTNTYYSSTGDVAANISYNATTNVLTFVFDIDGNVYGGSDPAPENFIIDMSDFIANGTDDIAVTSATYGDVTVTLTFKTDGTGTFAGTAVSANPNITDAQFSGTFEISGGTVSFTLNNSSFTYYGTPITCTSDLTVTLN